MTEHVNYHSLSYKARRLKRDEYVKSQNGNCFWCNLPLDQEPVKDKKLNMSLFPDGFLDHPIHLQHDHRTGMTEGAVHAYCNGIMWQYYGR